MTLAETISEFVEWHARDEALRDLDEFIRFVMENQEEAQEVGLLSRIITLLDIKEVIRKMPEVSN